MEALKEKSDENNKNELDTDGMLREKAFFLFFLFLGDIKLLFFWNIQACFKSSQSSVRFAYKKLKRQCGLSLVQFNSLFQIPTLKSFHLTQKTKKVWTLKVKS